MIKDNAPVARKRRTSAQKAKKATRPPTRYVVIEETVLTYRREQLKAWKTGDRSIAPAFLKITTNYQNQPHYHFGETFTLRHFHKTEGWKGFASYALGPQYPGSQRREAGRRKAKEVIPEAKLQRLLERRSSPRLKRRGSGEPDLFLYKRDGSFKFAEVKKGSDRLSHRQLTCIAQVLAILRCDVSIVYLRREDQIYVPKTYRFNLTRMTGRRFRPVLS